MDRQSAYVAVSRHRDGVKLHYGRDDFGDDRRLVRTLSRERAKDMASDYGRDRDAEIRAFADRRGLSGETRLPERAERSPEIGRAHVCNPDTNAQPGCRLSHDTNKNEDKQQS